MPTQEKQHTIPTFAFVLMLAVAIFYDVWQAGVDALHFIPLIGNAFAFLGTLIIDVWAFLTFYVWFKLYGVSFASPKRGLTMAGTVLIEIIPALNALPAWTGAVVILFLTTRGEEELGKTLGRVGGAAQAVSKSAKLAGKIPGAPQGLKQGLSKASETADKVSEGAQNAQRRLQSLPAEKKTHLETASKERKQAPPRSTPPVIAPPPAQPAGDIGGQPVFHKPADQVPAPTTGEKPTESAQPKQPEQQGETPTDSKEKPTAPKTPVSQKPKEKSGELPQDMRQDIGRKITAGNANAISESRLQELEQRLAELERLTIAEGQVSKAIETEIATIESEIFSSCAIVDSVMKFKEMLKQLHIPEAKIEDTVAHENAHANVSTETGHIPVGFATLFVKDTHGNKSIQPLHIDRPDPSWPLKKRLELRIKTLTAPARYGNTLSPGDTEDIARTEEHLRTVQTKQEPDIERINRENRARIEREASEVVHKIQEGEEIPSRSQSTGTAPTNTGPTPER